MKKLVILLIVCLILPQIAFAQEAETTAVEIPTIVRPVIRILNAQTLELKTEFYPFAEDSGSQGANIATADLNKDGYKEIIVAAGRNEKPYVRIFNYKGEFQYEFLAYAEKFRRGFKIYVADLYQDGSPEIITAPNEGGGPQIRIFDNLGFVYFSFFAFDQSLRGGANVTVGDVNGDSQNEIIVGAGYGQEPIVKIFDNYSNFIKELTVYDKTFKGGVSVLAADLDNNNKAEIIVAPYIDYKPLIKILDYEGNVSKEFLAYSSGFWGGVNLAASDVNKDGDLEIMTGPGYGGGAHLRFFDKNGSPIVHPKLFAFEDFKGGLSIADGDIDKDNKTEILAATQTISPSGKYEAHKLIEIDIAKQKLYVYFKGLLEKEFIVSTGKNKYPTPLGDFKIYSKVESTDMSGFYGPDNPDNYDLPDVPHVMSFYKGYAIHGAYWHWRFGTRVSHGCVNLKLKDAEWLYHFTPMGTPVKIYNSKK